MREDNITCIQHAKFIFDFFEKREWAPGEEAPLKKITGARKVEPGAVRNLGNFLAVRLDRIARMMELLLAAHDNWAVTGKKDRVVMETSSFDFNNATALLKEHGFHDDEYVLQVEYERKWGML